MQNCDFAKLNESNTAKSPFTHSLKNFVCRMHFCVFKKNFERKKFPAYAKKKQKTLGVRIFLRYL